MISKYNNYMVVKMKSSLPKISTLILLLLLSACFSDTKNSKENIVIEIANENYASAIISLKNLIHSDTKNHELRLLLGEVYLKQGNLLDAEKEYLKSIDLGANINEFATPYFKVNYFLNNTQLIINEWGTFQNNPLLKKSDELITIVALAYLEEDNFAQATSIIQSFIQDKEINNVPLSNATLNYIENGIFNTSNLAKIVQKHPKNILPLFLLAKNYEQIKEYEKSAETYKQLSLLQTSRDTIQILIADNYIKAKQYNNAQTVIDTLLKKYPTNDSVNLLQAYIYLEKQDYENAKKHAETAKANSNASIQAHMIAGVSNYYLKNYEIAFENLQFVENNIEQENPTKRILIATQLELGYSNETVENLSSLKIYSAVDGELIAKASYDLIQQGNSKDALSLINSLPSEYIKSTQTKQKLSLLKLALGDSTGFAELKVLADSKSNDEKSKIIYVASLIASNNSVEAKNTLDEWMKNEDLSQALKILLAKAESKLGNSERSISLFNHVLKETNPTTNLTTVELALAQEYSKVKDYQNAQKLYEKVIEKDEINEAAILGYLYVSLFNQSNDSALKRVEDILVNYKQDPEQKIILAKAYILSQYSIKVIKLLTADEIKGDDTQKFEQWLMLGDSYLSINLHKQATEFFSKLPSSMQNSKIMETRYFQLYEKTREYKKALSLINNKLLKSNSTHYKLLQIHFQTLDNQSTLALKNIDKLTPSQRKLPIIIGLKGRALLKNQQEKDALPLLQTTYDLYPSSINALMLFRAIHKVKGKSDAIVHLEKHLDALPNDEASRMVYATLLENKNDAIEQYKILQNSPVENYIVLNNLAWALYEQQKYQEAKQYAERAYKIAPTHKSVINTLDKINNALKPKG